jgi:hypothetical protein
MKNEITQFYRSVLVFAILLSKSLGFPHQFRDYLLLIFDPLLFRAVRLFNKEDYLHFFAISTLWAVLYLVDEIGQSVFRLFWLCVVMSFESFYSICVKDSSARLLLSDGYVSLNFIQNLWFDRVKVIVMSNLEKSQHGRNGSNLKENIVFFYYPFKNLFKYLFQFILTDFNLSYR